MVPDLRAREGIAEGAVVSAERAFDAEFVPGHFASLPEGVYRATRAMSYSGAKKILRSPQHYLVSVTQPSPPTEAMEFGTAVGCGALEPQRFPERVVVAPDVNKRTNAGKDALAAFEAANVGRIVLSAEDHARARRCIDALWAHPAAQKLLGGAEIEGSLFWYDGRYGAPCKGRYDARNHGGLIDVKTTTDASPDAFARRAADLLYHVQAAAYFSGGEHVLGETPAFWAWIVVETEPPHGVAVYTADGPTILAGARLWDRALERYALAIKSGEWPGYPQTINRLPFPKWALRFAIE